MNSTSLLKLSVVAQTKEFLKFSIVLTGELH